MTGGIRLGRPHEPDVLVTDKLVIECKNEKTASVSGPAIKQVCEHASEHAKKQGAPWMVAKRQKGSPNWVMVIDGDWGLEILQKARVLKPQETVDGAQERQRFPRTRGDRPLALGGYDHRAELQADHGGTESSPRRAEI